MRRFEVYKHPVLGAEAIKHGISWPALFFPFIWMFLKLLWRQAAIWFVCAISVSIVVGLSEGAESLSGKGIYIAALIADLVVWLAPGFIGNRWRAQELMSRGYTLDVTLEASSARDALAQVGAQQTLRGDSRKPARASS